jgi:hypothetical protein
VGGRRDNTGIRRENPHYITGEEGYSTSIMREDLGRTAQYSRKKTE